MDINYMERILHNLKLNLIQSADQEDASQITKKSHSDIQLTIQFHHLELTQIFQVLLKTLMQLKECTIINGNLEHLILRLNGIIPLKILCIILNLSLIKTSKQLQTLLELQKIKLVITGNQQLKLGQSLIQFADLEDAFLIMLKSHSDIQLITQSHHLELTQIFQVLLITLILLKECTIINGNLELLIQRLSGIILQKILSITLNLNLIKISKILILI